ncbi:heat-inducible transcriptional repressor HrcA [Melioribacteraceae bacterium 4301-Me]|uniref:heat-inducible transcriptional repressor HrcA n=1 Tax=Pyranulibacter aquaticus TaxID=3163344 RepID=UPI00359B66E5
MTENILKEREKAILRYVIHQFILNAMPVGSRLISKKYNLGLSSATIRNIMSDLEEMGYLDHPHTSAGRIPTDKGYRVYVDSLMDPPVLDREAKKIIDMNFETQFSDAEELLRITSYVLSELTNQLALVTYPKFDQAVLEKIQIVRLSSTRVLVVVSIRSGMVRTITLEINAESKEEHIELVQNYLNEKLCGLTFTEIKNSFEERMRDVNKDSLQPVIRVFIESVDKIFKDTSTDKALVTGTKNILKHPEFIDPSNIQTIIELIENQDIIIHILDNRRENDPNKVSVSIGGEINDEKLSEYSMITKEYSIGDVKGTLGIMGPKRMEYPKMIATIEYIAEQLSKELTQIG